MKALGWVLIVTIPWLILWASTDVRRFRAFAAAGLWSAALALAGEALIRRHVPFFNTDALLVEVFGADLLLLVGPRFVEGYLFVQKLRPNSQAAQIFIWTCAVLLSEVSLSLANYVHPSLEGFSVSFITHALRFTCLLGIFYSFDFAPQKMWIEEQEQQKARAKMMRKASRHLWAMSWPLF